MRFPDPEVPDCERFPLCGTSNGEISCAEVANAGNSSKSRVSQAKRGEAKLGLVLLVARKAGFEGSHCVFCCIRWPGRTHRLTHGGRGPCIRMNSWTHIDDLNVTALLGEMKARVPGTCSSQGQDNGENNHEFQVCWGFGY